jgi:uncharacterized membrane protein
MSRKVSSWFRKERTEALTDGLFATVMTILVLSLERRSLWKRHMLFLFGYK